MRLAAEEMETLIRWNEEENFAVIWTSSPRAQVRLARMGLEPARREGDGTRYAVPKGAVQLKPGRSAVLIAGGRDDLKAFLRGEWRPEPAQGDLKGREGGLTLYEQETFINWDERGPEAEIYTTSPRVRARLERAGLRPVREDGWALVYRVSREAVRLKLRATVRVAGSGGKKGRYQGAGRFSEEAASPGFMRV